MRLELLTSLLFLPGLVLALELAPEAVMLRGGPGEKISAELIVINESTQTAHVRLEISSAPWMRVSPKGMRLEPGTSRAAKLAARVPKAMGEVSGEVWARSFSPSRLSETRVVRRVTLWIEGTEVFEASLARPAAREETGRVLVSSNLQNTGNVSIRPKVVAEFERRDGNRVSVVLDLTNPPLAPGESIPVEAEYPIDTGDWTGKGRLSAYYRDGSGNTLQIHEPFGEYRAKP